MANFLLFHESDPALREHLRIKFRQSLSANHSRTVQEFMEGPWVLLWAAFPGAPVGIATDDSGFVTLLLGEPLEHDSNDFARPSCVGRGLRENPVPTSHDGFFAAISFHPLKNEVAIGGDLVGVFPIYHASSRSSFLASSRQDTILLDPRVDHGIDLVGLAGILHSCGLVGQRTLHSGIARLRARHVLRWSMGKEAIQVAQAPLGTSPERMAALKDASDAELSELVWESGRSAIRRMTPRQTRLGMYLSGGLDSRNIAALAHSEGLDPICFTFGSPWEIEAVIAGQTARKLGWKRHRLSEPLGEYPTIARDLVHRERLANGLGFSFGPIQLDPSCLTLYSNRVLTGLELDYITEGDSVSEHPEAMLEKGFTTSEMDRLTEGSPLAEPWRDLSADLRRRYSLREDFETMALDHRARFHVGSNFWRTAHGAWPISPVFSRSYHDLWINLPPHAHEGRRLQKVSIREKCPVLAGIPLDRNETSWYNLDPSRSDRLCTLELKLVRKISHLTRRESRYYSATYGLENSAWSSIRKQAEPGRTWLESLVNPGALREMIPPGETPIPVDPAAPIPSAAPRKILLGLMLLAADGLES